MTAGRVEIDRRVDPAQEAALHQANVQLPNSAGHGHRAESPASAIWIGTREGAVRLSRDYRTREYFAGQALAARRSRHRDRLRRRGDLARDARRLRAHRRRADDAGREVPRLRQRVCRRATTAGGSPPIRSCGSRGISRATRWCRATTTACGRRCTSPPRASATRSPARPTRATNAKQGMNALVRLKRSPGFRGFRRARSSRSAPTCSRQDGEWHDTPDQAVALEGRHELRRDRRPLLRVSDLLRPGGDEAEKPALRAVDRTDHQSHPRQQLPAGWPAASGRAGAGGGPRPSGRTRTKRGCARCTCCRICASRCT